MSESGQQPEDLSTLRHELDAIDRELLAATARRLNVVRQIASAKAKQGNRPIFDRSREREVYAQLGRLADQFGLPRALAMQIMQPLVEHSHGIQERHLRETTTADMRQSVGAPRVLIVGGEGRMAQRFSKAFCERGWVVESLDRDGPRDSQSLVAAADIVMVAVPMHVVCETIESIAAHVREDALLCDINSLKQNVCDTMRRHGRCEALGLHPMFGPTVGTFRRQKIVVCRVRSGPRSEWLLREFGHMGVELIECSPQDHDHMMAVVQVLVHLATIVMGCALRDCNTSIEESLRFTSPIYRLELALVGRLFAQNPDLYAEIMMTNPHGDEIRRHFLEAASTLDTILANGDRERFRKLFSEVSDYFAGFAGEAMELSNTIIDTLVKRP